MSNPHITKISRKIFQISLYGFALFGFVSIGVFVAMRLHLTNVAGSIDARNEYFTVVKNQVANAYSGVSGTPTNHDPSRLDQVTECHIMTIAQVLPENGKVILDTYTITKQATVAEKMVRAVALVTENNSFLQDKLQKCEIFARGENSIQTTPSNQTIFDWILSPEWVALRDALVKDKEVILQASKDSGVPARLIVSTVISEQFRFFTSNRESFKRYFEPLKILGNGTQFSYGVAGVKFETADQIESYLKNPNSKFYLGKDYEHMFDYKTDDPYAERLNRLTDTKNHYYSYFYTGIFLKQIMHQWEVAGYPVNDRPEVLATLFNIGFNKSVPKPHPEVGGSTITINDRDYTFGGLSYQFYYSGELADIFPLGVE